jgi:hypothetical protein
MSLYDRQSVSVSNPIWGPRPDFCYCQTSAVLSMLGALSVERTSLSFTAVKISNTCHLYLQFYMSAFYIVSCQESGSVWIPTIYNFRCNSSVRVYMYVQYIRVRGLYQSRLGTKERAPTHVDRVTTAA